MIITPKGKRLLACLMSITVITSTFPVQAAEPAGNTTTAIYTGKITVDKTAPSIPTLTVANDTVTIDPVSTDNLSGIKGYQFRTTLEGKSPTAWTPIEASTSYTPTQDGDQLVESKSVDNADNESTIRSINVRKTGSKLIEITADVLAQDEILSDLASAEAKVIKAETDLEWIDAEDAQASLTPIQTKINNLINTPEKTELQNTYNSLSDRLETVRETLVTNDIATANTSVDYAREYPIDTRVDDAQTKISEVQTKLDTLKSGAIKTQLQQSLDELQTSLDSSKDDYITNVLTQSESAISIAEADPTDTNRTNAANQLQTAQSEIDTIFGEGQGGTHQLNWNLLQHRLNQVLQGVTADLAMKQAEAQVALTDLSPTEQHLATSQELIDTAEVEISKLDPGTNRTNLETRLADTKAELQRIKDWLASTIADIEVKIPLMEAMSDTEEVQILINSLPTGTDKDNLQYKFDKRVLVIEVTDLANSAETHVVNAETSYSQEEIDTATQLITEALGKIDGIIDESANTNLQAKLSDYQQRLAEVTLGNTAQASIDSTQTILDTALSDPTASNLESAQQAINGSQLKVTVMKDSERKIELQSKIDTLQSSLDKRIEDLNNLVAEIKSDITNLDKLENVSAVQDKIDTLPEGADKDTVQALLEEKVKEIKSSLLIDQAEVEVAKAESNPTQSNLDSAQLAITKAQTEADKLQEGPAKVGQTNKLDGLQDRLNITITNLSNLIAEIGNDITALTNLEDVQAVQDKIDSLPEGSDKDSLQSLLDGKVLELVAREAISKAELAVETAEYAPTYIKIGIAQSEIDDSNNKIAQVAEGQVKEDLISEVTALQSRLDKVKSDLDNAISEIENAIDALSNLENVAVVQDKINLLQDSTDKDRLQGLLDEKVLEIKARIAIDQAIASVEEAQLIPTYLRIEEAQTLITTAEGEIAKLNDSTVKTEYTIEIGELQTKLDGIKGELDSKITDIETSIEALTNLEQVDSIQSLIDSIPTSPDKDRLQALMDEKVLEIKAKMALDAVDVVIAEMEEGNLSYANILKAEDLLEVAKTETAKLQSGQVKTTLEEYLVIREGRIEAFKHQLDSSIEIIKTMIKDLDNLVDVEDIQGMVDALPGQTEKQELQDLLDERVLEIKSGSALVQATTDVESAEQDPTRSKIATAQTSINATEEEISKLKDGQVKEDLTSELASLQTRLDLLRSDLENTIIEIEGDINDLSDLDNVSDVQDKIDSMPEGEDKDRLQELLNDKIKELEAIASTAKATKDVEAAEENPNKSTISKAQSSIDATSVEVANLKDSQTKENLTAELKALQVRVDILNGELDKIIKDIENLINDLTSLEGVDEVQSTIDSLPDINGKEELQELLNDKILELKAKKSLEQAEKDLEDAESIPTQTRIDKATDSIDNAELEISKLKDGQAKANLTLELEELRTRLNNITLGDTPVELEISYDDTVWQRYMTVNGNIKGEVKEIRLPNGSKIYTNDFKYIIRNNGTYTFEVIGKDGKSRDVQKVIASRIDPNNPKLDFEIDYDSGTVTVNTSDSDSGVLSLTLPDGQQINSSSYTFNRGDHSGTFTVIDQAGNTSTREFLSNSEDGTDIDISGNSNRWVKEDLSIKVGARNLIDGVQDILLEGENFLKSIELPPIPVALSDIMEVFGFGEGEGEGGTEDNSGTETPEPEEQTPAEPEPSEPEPEPEPGTPGTDEGGSEPETSDLGTEDNNEGLEEESPTPNPEDVTEPGINPEDELQGPEGGIAGEGMPLSQEELIASIELAIESLTDITGAEEIQAQIDQVEDALEQYRLQLDLNKKIKELEEPKEQSLFGKVEEILISGNTAIKYTINKLTTALTGTVEVDRIDKTAPVVNVSVDYNQVSYQITDDRSGIKTIYLPNGEVVEISQDQILSQDGQITMLGDGTFTIAVEDFAGNIAEKNFNMSSTKQDPIKQRVSLIGLGLSTAKGLEYDPGETVTINIKPPVGSSIKSFKVNGRDETYSIVDNLYSFVITEDTTVTIEYNYPTQSGGGSKPEYKEPIKEVKKDETNYVPYTLLTVDISKIKDNKVNIDGKELAIVSKEGNILTLSDGSKIELIETAVSSGAVQVPAKHWAKEAIQRTVGKGYFVGDVDGDLKVNNNITGKESVVAYNRLLLAKDMNENKLGRDEVDKKVKVEGWAELSVKAVASKFDEQYLNKFSLLDLNKAITRGNIASIIYHSIDKDRVEQKYDIVNYKDNFNHIKNKEIVDFTTKTGIFAGDNNGNFNYNAEITRAEFMAVLDRLDTLVKDPINKK